MWSPATGQSRLTKFNKNKPAIKELNQNRYQQQISCYLFNNQNQSGIKNTRLLSDGFCCPLRELWIFLVVLETRDQATSFYQKDLEDPPKLEDPKPQRINKHVYWISKKLLYLSVHRFHSQLCILFAVKPHIAIS